MAARGSAWQRACFSTRPHACGLAGRGFRPLEAASSWQQFAARRGTGSILADRRGTQRRQGPYAHGPSACKHAGCAAPCCARHSTGLRASAMHAHPQDTLLHMTYYADLHLHIQMPAVCIMCRMHAIQSGIPVAHHIHLHVHGTFHNIHPHGYTWNSAICACTTSTTWSIQYARCPAPHPHPPHPHSTVREVRGHWPPPRRSEETAEATAWGVSFFYEVVGRHSEVPRSDLGSFSRRRLRPTTPPCVCLCSCVHPHRRMASVDIDALSAREIKERLTAARVDFSDCFEKRELVKRLRDHCRALDDDKVQEVKALANRCCGASYFPGYARGAACVSWRGVCSTPTL